jgi:hypothetical protein
MPFEKSAAEAALSNLNMTVTPRRGGNLQVSFESLGDFKHVIDDNGVETMSRDESIMRHQLAAVDALRAAGAPARISNIRRQEIGGEEVYTFSPSIWVNNVSNAGASAAAISAANAKAEAAEKRFAALLSALPADIQAAVAASLEGESAQDEEIPL